MSLMRVLFFLGFFSHLFNALEASYSGYSCIPKSELKKSNPSYCTFALSSETPRMIKLFVNKNVAMVLSHPFKTESALIKFIEEIRPEFLQNQFWSNHVAQVSSAWRKFLKSFRSKYHDPSCALFEAFLKNLILGLDCEFLLAHRSSDFIYWTDCYGQSCVSFEVFGDVKKLTSEDEQKTIWLQVRSPKNVTIQSLKKLIRRYQQKWGYIPRKDQEIIQACENFLNFYEKTKAPRENPKKVISDFVLRVCDSSESLENIFNAMIILDAMKKKDEEGLGPLFDNLQIS